MKTEKNSVLAAVKRWLVVCLLASAQATLAQVEVNFVRKFVPPLPFVPGLSTIGVNRIAIEGDIAIYSTKESTGGTWRGGLLIYRKDAGGPNNWGLVKRIIGGSGPASGLTVYTNQGNSQDNFGNSIAYQNGTLVVGAHGDTEGGGFERGAVYVFHRNQGGADNWGLVKKISNGSTVNLVSRNGQRFGEALALRNDLLLVGAPADDHVSFQVSGAIYVFRRDEGGPNNWGLVRKIVNNIGSSVGQVNFLNVQGANMDFFGGEIAIDDTGYHVAVRSTDRNSGDRGAVYILGRDVGGTDNFGLLRKIVNTSGTNTSLITYTNNTASNSILGITSNGTMRLENDLLLIGASSDNEGGPSKGAFFIFGRNEGGPDQWGLVKKICGGTGINTSIKNFYNNVEIGNFSALDIENDLLVASVGYDRFFVFDRNEGGANNWGLVHETRAGTGANTPTLTFFPQIQPNTTFAANGVLMYGSSLMAVAAQDDEAGNNAGAAYMFTINRASTIWNGTAWNPAPPDNTKSAIINGPYNTMIHGNFTASRLVVNAGRVLTLHSAANVNIGAGSIENNGDIDNCAGGTLTFGAASGNAIRQRAPLPTADATGPMASNLTGTSLRLSWTGGGGTHRMVVAKEGAAVANNAPVFGTAYTASSDFTSVASSVLDGGKVVFAGAGTSVDITGLTPGATYHFSVFEYNITAGCGPNYRVGSPSVYVQPMPYVWTGTAWQPAPPTASVAALLNGNFSTASHGNLTAASLTISGGFSLTMHEGGAVQVTGHIQNGGTLDNCAGGTLSFASASGNTILNKAATPSINSDNLAFTNVRGISLTLSWNIGNGNARAVVLKAGSPVSENALTDGTIYTANPNFTGNGSTVDTSGKVVYIGTGSSVSITGLVPGETYYARVFEYNENPQCGINYSSGGASVANITMPTATTWNGSAWSFGEPVAMPLPGMAAIIAVNFTAPANGNITASSLTVNAGVTLTMQASASININGSIVNNGTLDNCANGTLTYASSSGNTLKLKAPEVSNEAHTLVFSNITGSSMRLSWALGGGTGRVVVVKRGAAVSSAALTDGTFYTADANFSGGGSMVDGTAKVVYIGSGSSVAITGLLHNTTYHVAIFEFNETAECGRNFRTGSPASGNATTPNQTVWNGTSWSAGAPTPGMEVVILGNYNTATHGDITAAALVVNVGSTLTLHALGSVNIGGNITNNGTINNCEGGNLVFGTYTGPVPLVNTEPTVQATNAQVSSIGGWRFNLNFASGNGLKRLVVVKPNSPVNAGAVIDGTAYTPDANFAGAGSPVDGTGKVVYTGTGNSLTVTGLMPGTSYHVAVFEYNDICPPNYLNTNPARADLTTATQTVWNGTAWSAHAPVAGMEAVIAGDYNTGTHGNITARDIRVQSGHSLVLHAAGTVNAERSLNEGTVNYCVGTWNVPTEQGTGVYRRPLPTQEATQATLVSVGPREFTFRWANGNGEQRMVVVKPENAINPNAPVNGTAYTANANFAGAGSPVDGTGKVVYTGTGSEITVTGLDPGQLYHIAVFEYNTFCTSTPRYKLGSPLRGRAATLPSTIWGGSQWSEGPPNERMNAILSAPYNTALHGNFVAGNLIVNGGALLQLHAQGRVEVRQMVMNNGQIENCANGDFRFATYTGTAVVVPPTVPAQAASGLGVANVRNTRLTLQWANGNGNRRLVLLRQGSPVDFKPADGTNYNGANANLGNGHWLLASTGNNQLQVEGLEPGTTYHFAVIEFNQNACGTRYAATAATASQNTTALTVWQNGGWTEGPPTARLQARIEDTYQTQEHGNIRAARVEVAAGQRLVLHAQGRIEAATLLNNGAVENCAGGNMAANVEGNPIVTPAAEPNALAAAAQVEIVNQSINLRWANGSGAQRLVLVRAGSPVNFVPTDRQNYAGANANLGLARNLGGGNLLVANGNVNQLAITGLREDERYFLAIFEYNQNGCGPNYTSTAYTLDMGGILGRPTLVQNTAVDITTNSFGLRVGATGSIAPSGFRIDVSTSPNFEQLLPNWADRPVPLAGQVLGDGLQMDQVYYIRARAENGLSRSANSETLMLRTALPGIANLAATNVTEAAFGLRWQLAEAPRPGLAVEYRVQLGTSAQAWDVSANLLLTPNTSVANIAALPQGEALQPDTEYFVRVVALFRRADNTIVERPAEVLALRTAPLPRFLAVSEVAADAFTLNWPAHPQVAAYLIDVLLDNNGRLLPVAGFQARRATGNSLRVTGLRRNARYLFRADLETQSGALVRWRGEPIAVWTLPPNPDFVQLRRLSEARTTEIFWTYNAPQTNLEFVVERSDNTGLPFRAISPTIQLTNGTRALYNDVTGTQVLRATYRLRISNPGHTVLFEIPRQVITSLEQPAADLAPRLFPNPAREWLVLEAPRAWQKVQCRIVDASGRTVQQTEHDFATQEALRLLIGDLPRGTYRLVLQGEQMGPQAWPFVKE